MEAKVLIISDEIESAQVWGVTLNHIGLAYTIVGIERDVSAVLSDETPDLVIIEDFNARNEELDICRTLRKETAIPILYMTSKTEEAFVLETYRAGADETIPFPISPRLFLAKVKAWLRRTASIPLTGLDEVKTGKFRLQPASRLLTLPTGQQIHLTVLEARLLFYMMSHADHLVQTNHLIEHIWGYYGDGDHAMLKSLIYRVRRKIEPSPGQPKYLRSEASLGYRFIDEDSS